MVGGKRCFTMREILIDCGINYLHNDRTQIQKNTLAIMMRYNISSFNIEFINKFLYMYDNIHINARIASSISGKSYWFHGGVKISSTMLLDLFEYYYDEFRDICNTTNEKLFPIGSGFDDVVSISEDENIYVLDQLVANSWEEFLDSLVADKYMYL